MLQYQLFLLIDGSGLECINPMLNDNISNFCFFNPIYSFLDVVDGVEKVTFSILNCMPITHVEEHLSKEKMSGRRNMRSDVRHQGFNCFHGSEEQYQIRSNDDF